MKKITNSAIQSFKTHLTNEEKAAATVEKYIRDLTAFAAWLRGGELCKEKVIEYKEYLKEHYAKTSVNSVLASLNSFFDYKKLYGLKVKNLKIQQNIFANKEKELTKAEYERLLRAAKRNGNRKLFLLMQTICSTGIRVSELKFITVSAINCGQADIDCKGKSRRVIIPDALCKVLKKYISEQKITSGSVFVSKSGKPLDRSNIWKLMKRLSEDAGVSKEKIFPHNLRHLFARTYYGIEKDIARLADILGHSSIETTRIYTMESGDIHRKQIQKLGLLQC